MMPLVDFCIANFDEREIKNFAKMAYLTTTVQFGVEFLNKKKKMAGTRESWVGAKEKLVAYKNSMFIMQHFQTNLPQVEPEQKNKIKAIKYALFHDSRYREH